MLTYYPVGPFEDQTYSVAYLTPGCKLGTVVCEHMNEQQAIDEARERNGEAKRAEALTQVERKWRLRGVGEH
jgi:hypothetical protein